MLKDNQNNNHKHDADQINVQGEYQNIPTGDLEAALAAINELLKYSPKYMMVSANDGMPLIDQNGDFIYATQ